MKTFTWKYGKEQLPFEENFDEQYYKNEAFDDSRKKFFNENYNEGDIKDVKELKQPSEYLFEIHLLKLMKNIIAKNEYNITDKVINLGYDVIHTFFAYSKGLIVDIEKTKDAENSNTNLRNEIYQFIDYCRQTWRSYESFNAVSQEFPQLFDRKSPYFHEITAIQDYLLSKKHANQPYHLYEKLVMKVSPLMKERRQLIRMIKYTILYNNEMRSYYNNALTCQMILNDSYYFDFINKASNQILLDTTNTINAYLNASSTDEFNFTNSINRMIDCINSCDKGGNHNFGRFIGNKKGCFCVFDINTDEYVSFSGPFDISDPQIEAYFNFNQRKKQSNEALMNKINSIILADSTFQKSKYANLNLLTMRYTYGKTFNIPSGGESVGEAISRHVDSKEIQSDYSCCERKIFSFISNSEVGQCYMFARNEPCEKCKPAIKKFLKIPGRQMRIFYYDNGVKEFDMNTI